MATTLEKQSPPSALVPTSPAQTAVTVSQVGLGSPTAAAAAATVLGGAVVANAVAAQQQTGLSQDQGGNVSLTVRLIMQGKVSLIPMDGNPIHAHIGIDYID